MQLLLDSSRFTQDAREEMQDGFTPGSIDFWTDSHRKEQFGAFVINLVAECYAMENGQDFFMSRQTRDSLDTVSFVAGQADPQLRVLEYPLNFECFEKSKTIANVVAWMHESTAEAKIRDEDFGHLSADGGSNAVGSIQEFELIGQEEGRGNTLDFNICASHQNERSGGYASGTCKFADDPNQLLGDVLKKNHRLQEEMNRNPQRMDVYGSVQDRKGRESQS